ncbi:GNAT family N-acetyltransferase [Nesterenkonia sp. NBAIMH1]|uniref:GNAT family N-acetyltransferase n=1 Tax=Nesterenkonia sp. NBAIMH1 TaxID=2600320 RepID=UPI00143CEA9B|nr:GNAT family N-acetyltransferase [Nesterenkonia sp. NBAIMH1]
MGVELNDDLVSTWVTGWARTHNYEVTHEGRVHTAQPTTDPEALEHVLYAPDEVELRRIASAVGRSPKRLLTVIAEPNDEVMDLRTIDGLELISDEEVIMIADMEHQDVEDPITPEEFTTSRDDFDEWTLFTVKHGDATAARGRLAVVNGFSILDRIYTSPDYRRQGLGTFVTRALLAIAHEQEVEHGLLVATHDGRELYEYLGWERVGDVHVFGAPGATDRRRPSHSQHDNI